MPIAAQLLNTESGAITKLQYIPMELQHGAIAASYAAASIPQSTSTKPYWQGSAAKAGAIAVTFQGGNVKQKVEELRSLTLPPKGKSAPAIVILQLGLLPPIRCVITEVSPQYQMVKFDSQGNPTRASVNVSYLPVA